MIDYEYLIHSHSCAGSKHCDMGLTCQECIKRDFDAVGLVYVEEFVEKLKKQLQKQSNDYMSGKTAFWESGVDEKTIDKLFTELYEEEE